MNLTELITYFRTTGNLGEFYKKNSLDTESEVVEIYMQKPLSIENKLAFFEIERTEGKIEFEVQNVLYHNLIDLYYFLDFIEESKLKQELTDIELAEILLYYCINDA